MEVSRGEGAKWEHNENVYSPSHSPSKEVDRLLIVQAEPSHIWPSPDRTKTSPASAPPPPSGAADPCPESAAKSKC